MPLPRSALLSLWLNSTLAGSVGPDDFADAVRAEDPQHLVLDWPGADGSMSLLQLPGAVRDRRGRCAALALPVPGDPTGLAGPVEFNAEALQRGEAVVILGERPIGLLAEVDARTVVWAAHDAAAPALLDPWEEGRLLRQVLLESTRELVRLDVAAWQPEIPDLLLNVGLRDPLPLPPDTPARAVESIERAVLCLEIVDLARAEDGGALTSFEIAARSRCLTDLDLAARRALVAFCSANLITS